jgi:hypothetical protein
MKNRSSLSLLAVIVLSFAATSSFAGAFPIPGTKANILTQVTAQPGKVFILGTAISSGKNLFGGILKSTHKLAGPVNLQKTFTAKDPRRFGGAQYVWSAINHGWTVSLPKGNYTLASSIERWAYDANNKLTLLYTWVAPVKTFVIP